jgi:hypothetical protein
VVFIFIVGYQKISKKIKNKKMKNKKNIFIFIATTGILAGSYILYDNYQNKEINNLTDEIYNTLKSNPNSLDFNKISNLDFYFIQFLAKNHKKTCKWINYYEVVSIIRMQNEKLLKDTIIELKSNKKTLLKKYIIKLFEYANQICNPKK